MDFSQLQKEYSHCCKCSELCKSRSQVVFGSGNKEADVLFVGEAPGASEDKQGIPFCGMSGKILNELLNSVGLSREEIFITNTVLCRPEGNRNPAKDEIENCRERLDKLIEVMRPKVIVTIGNFATERIIGKTGIKSIHGQLFDFKDENNGDIKVVPVVHPASYLYSGRNPELFEQMKNDFKIIAKVVNSKIKQKSLGGF
ncbi:uracil-DNA glycosylase [Candidatus Woesearchaeota archaeon CG_4_10_14_0_2_um_filter_33_13]|nr:MAG: uracil-DNA glycosylase [Candidatus Woesearchaeota archaeon CG_4_10_14_0_2_um_filter_33_13]